MYCTIDCHCDLRSKLVRNQVYASIQFGVHLDGDNTSPTLPRRKNRKQNVVQFLGAKTLYGLSRKIVIGEEMRNQVMWIVDNAVLLYRDRNGKPKR